MQWVFSSQVFNGFLHQFLKLRKMSLGIDGACLHGLNSRQLLATYRIILRANSFEILLCSFERLLVLCYIANFETDVLHDHVHLHSQLKNCILAWFKQYLVLLYFQQLHLTFFFQLALPARAQTAKISEEILALQLTSTLLKGFFLFSKHLLSQFDIRNGLFVVASLKFLLCSRRKQPASLLPIQQLKA